MRDLNGRETRGVVAEVTPTQIVLVSMTGTRTRLSPTSFQLLWSFAQAPPRTGLSCVRRPCSEAAIFRTRRDAVEEYVCPRHMPVGVQAEFLTNVPEGIGNRSYVEVICPSCASPDPTEDLALPRPDKAPWSWWTCHLCSRAWVTIPSPPDDVVGLTARGRWYHTQILSALGVVSAIGTLDRIEAGRGAVGDVHSVPSSDRTRFKQEDVRLVLEIEPSVIHVVMQSRPARLARERARMGVQRLGGRPDRPPEEGSNVVAFRPRPTPATATTPAQPTPPSSPPPSPETPAAPEVREMRAATLVPVGSTWRRINTNDIVEILGYVRDENGAEVVRVQRADDRLPAMFALADFIAAFLPTDRADDEKLFNEIAVKDEWRGVDGVAVVVTSKQPKRRTITVALPEGDTRVLSVGDFRGMQRVVRRSAYERLRPIRSIEKKE